MILINFDNMHEPFFHLEEQKAKQKYDFINLFVKNLSFLSLILNAMQD